MIGHVLRYKGYEPGPDGPVVVVENRIARWEHADPQPTLQQLAAWAAEPAFATWLAEHGGDADLTRRRQLREMIADETQPLRTLLLAVQKLLVDATAREVLAPAEAETLSDLYPPWKPGSAYAVNDLCSHNLHLYRVLQAHTSQADWTPDVVPALFARYYEPNVIPAWVQPTGGHDAYAIGAQVAHNGNTWRSLINANVWEPGVFGWEEV